MVERFSKEGLTTEALIQEARDFLESNEENEYLGFCKSSYRTSKMMLNYWSRFLLP